MVYVVTHAEEEYDPNAVLTASKNLSVFQKAKLTYMFSHLFDHNGDGVIEEEDILGLVERMRVYNGWLRNSDNYQNILDVHKVFLECLTDQVRAEKAASAQDDVIGTWKQAMQPEKEEKITCNLQQWLNMWGRLTHGSAGLNDFPCWVQLLPSIYFRVMDNDNDGIISKVELLNFYMDFVGVEGDIKKITDEGLRVMTAGGDYKLNMEQFGFVFANFLLGRGKYGPGKYVFGCFDNSEIDEHYQVIYNDEE